MGYTTDFSGKFNLTRPLTEEQSAYLRKFADTRRMKRHAVLTASRPDPLRVAARLPIGPEGGYFVNEEGTSGQGIGFGGDIEDVVDSNSPPADQPGLWCQWVPTADNCGIEWDGGEKFYNYIAWLEYLIVNFLMPWGHVLNGKVKWEGEENWDMGIIVVKDNVVSAKRARVSYD